MPGDVKGLLFFSGKKEQTFFKWLLKWPLPGNQACTQHQQRCDAVFAKTNSDGKHLS